MSIKDLFGKRSIHIVTQADADKLEKDIESTEYAEAKITDNMRFVPKVTVDFDDPKTFARYGSAEKYYEDAVYSILNKYPYDGSRKEKQEWHNKATYIDNWIFDNKYPRTTGYVSLNTSNAFTTPTAHTDTYVYRPFTNPQYVTIKGGPHPTPNNPDGKLSKEYPFWQGKSNIHDSTKIRESNLHVDGSVGNTIEFWWKKEAINESGIECLFYLTNGITIGTADWARLIIEHDDNTSSAAFLKLSYVQDNGSSTDVGIKRTGIGASADFPSGFDATKWNHYAISFKNASANTTHTDIKLYLNGKLISSATQVGTNSKQVSTFHWGTGLMAGLGAYLDAPTSGTYGSMLGVGATRSKFDEFRFWKKARTAEEIGRNWFTQVAGGTNTDDSNTDLGIYYKFNEGIVDPDTTNQADSTTLDYSGRISNGNIVNYNTEVRSTGSAIDESDLNNTEFKDPILYSIHPSVSSLLEQMKLEGSTHDMTNNSSIYHTLPEWITSDDFENNREDLLNLTQVIANYFDTLHLQIEALPALKNTDYVKDGEKPLPFATKLLESVGFLAPEMFVDSTVLESFLERNEERVFEKDISNVKNHIYQNIYNNISHIYKSKGTEKSFRNLLRCFGIGDQLIKINLYGDNISIKLANNYKSTSTRKNYLDFNDPDRHIISCYQESISGNADSTSFIAGSTTGQFDYIPFTFETEVIFPNKSGIDSPAFFNIDFTTISLFGMHEANPAAPTNLSWHGTDDCYFKVQAERVGVDALLDKETKFKLVTGLTSSTLESPVFNDVYDNQRWNFAVRLKVDKSSADLAAGTTDTTYTLEFHGVSVLLDLVQEEFTVTAPVTAVKAKAALNAAKRIFVGSEHTDFTGPAVDKCDAKISSVRYWLDYLDNDTIKFHSMDPTNYGSKNPSKPAYLQTSANQYNLLQADTLALHWNFETATVPVKPVVLVPATGSVTITSAAAGLIGDTVTILTTDQTQVVATASSTATTSGHTLNPTFKVPVLSVADPADLLLHFNSDSSSAPIDATGNTTATYENATGLESYSPGHFAGTGSSVYFNGSTTANQGQSIDIDYPSSLKLDGEFTIDFWAKFDDVASSASQSIVGYTGGDFYDDALLRMWYNSWGFSISIFPENEFGQDWTPNHPITLANDTWYHFALTRDSNDVLEFFVNGNSYGTDSHAFYSAEIDWGGELRLGRSDYSPVPTYPFKGYLDEFRIVKGQALWTSDFSSTFSGNEPGPYSLATTYDRDATATNLASCLEDNDLLSASSASGVVTIIQSVGGSAGNTDITLSSSTYMSKTDFVNGSSGTTGTLVSDAYFAVEDVSSGSYDMASTNFIYNALKYQHTGKADFYIGGDKKAIDKNYIFTAKQQLPEVVSSSDTVNILSQDDITFTKESRPIDYFWAIEKSMYQAVSDEMINIFASISDFNNLIGNPVNRYRMEYKELGKLRQMFFDKVEERPNIEKYVEFYKWIDSSVSGMIQELVPASANFSEEMRTMIESHVLERNKYWNKLPTLEMKAQIPESSALGINEMLYDWKNGYATVVEGDNALWWHDRVERDNSVIASGVEAVDDDRDNILHVATTHVTGSWMDKNLKSSSGSYKGSTYVLRNLSRPYNFSAKMEVETEDVIYPISITNIPSPPLDPAPFLEKHNGTFVDNPTSVINKQLGNYRFPYDIVQTSGRKNNNSWFNENGGLGSSILTAAESTTIHGHYDFTLPERTPKKHVFVERFSAPGAPATMQTGMLDVEGEEYSAYNSLNFRNLDVRLRLGEWLTKHFEWDDNIKTPGAPSIPAFVVGGPRENFHKLHRNVKHLYQSGGTCTNNYDNYWIQHQIPQSGYQYSWINSSVQTQDCPQGFATDYENIAPQYPQIQTDPSSVFYGLASGCHSAPTVLFHFNGNFNDSNFSSNLTVTNNSTNFTTGTDAFGNSSGQWVSLEDGEYFDITFTPGAANLIAWDAEFTIDFWVKFDSASVAGGANEEFMFINGIDEDDGDFALIRSSDATSGLVLAGWDVIRGWNDHAFYYDDETTVANTWYHIAITRDSSNMIRVFQDGVSLSGADDFGNGTAFTGAQGWLTTDNFTNSSGLRINSGITVGNGGDFHLDELRITKGSAVWTSNFTAPAASHSVCTTTTLDTGFPFLNKFQSWDKEKHANTYELVRTIDKDGEDIVKGYCPIYWSGSNIVGDDILSNETWDKYESGSLTFNELMLHRNGPYQHPSWKQIRNAENPAVIAMRNSNVISVLDKPSTIYFIEGVATGSFTQTRSGNSTNYIEPVVTWNRPMVHTVLPRKENKSVDLTSTYNNNIETFANPYLAARIEFKKSTEQMYDVIRKEYIIDLGDRNIYKAAGNFTLKKLKYSEYIFPKHNNSSLGRVRNRTDYSEVSGKSSNGYDRTSANIKTFWKNKPLDRQRTVYGHEEYLNTAENALGARVRNSSVWALDYFKYMTSGEDCTRYTGVTSVRSSSYVATMRGDLAWAGFAQHRGFIYEGTSIDVKSNEGNGRPSEDARLILPPRPTLQFIHNPNSQKAREEGWPWKAGEISGNAPWNDSYIDYSQDIRLMGQNYSILPEFRISEHMSYYIDDNNGDFTVDNGNILEISGVDKVVATASYYFSHGGAKENEIIRYSFEENSATGYTTLSKGYMHNTSVRDINTIAVQEASADIDSLSAWKSIKEYPVACLNKSTVASFLTTTKQNNMISKNNDQWMSADLEFGFIADTEFKLDATKNSWNNSSIRNRGMPVGYSPVTGGSAAWDDDYTWDRWENTFLMSFWVNLDKDALVARKADGESIGCLSLHDNRTRKVYSDYLGLDDAALKEAHGIKNTNASNSLAGALSPFSTEVKFIFENTRLHSDLSFESSTSNNKRKLENLQRILKDRELYPRSGSSQANFYLSDVDDEKGRACWVDTLGNKIYFNISPYFNLTDESKLPDLTPNQWNHVAILYLGGTSTADSSDMGFDARHHRVFLWINNKLIPSEVPSNLTSTVEAIDSEHPTNGTLHQYIARVNSRKIAGFGGKKGSLAFGKCDPIKDAHVSAFGYKMKSAILPGKVSDFVIIRGGEIGLVQDSETQPVFESTTVYTTYQAAGDKWDWLFNNENAFSTLSKMESSLIKDLYQHQSKDINTIVDNWKAKHIKYATTIAVSQNSTAGTTTSSTNAGSTDLTYNEAKANVQATTNFPVLSGYWKMGIASWKEEVDAISLVDKDFLDCYSHTDGIKHLSKIINDHHGDESVPVLRLEVDVVKKLIPYNGFYPSQRAVQLGNLFYDSVSPHVVGDNDTDPWSRARTEQALLQPLFAPGILFNSIKAGIAVDWAGYTGKYDSNRIDLRDKFLGDLNLVTPTDIASDNVAVTISSPLKPDYQIEELKNTAVGKAILDSAMAALSRDIELGKAQHSNISELFPKFIEKAKTKIGKEAQRMYKSATVRATTEDFEKWAFDNKKDVRVKSTLREFNRTQTKDLKWTPPSKPSIAISSNMLSIIGKDATVAIQNNPTKVQQLARNIVSAISNFSSKDIMYGSRGQVGMRSPMSDVSELDLEGTYLDKEPNIRIPFEALVSLSGHLPEATPGSDDKKVFYLAPSYYLERSETGNWDADDPTSDRNLYNNLRYPYFEWSGESNALYEMAMHNFLAEIPNFFLRDNKLTTFMSKAEGKFNSVEEGTVYYMDIDLYKTSDGFSTTISPYDGYLTSVYDNAADRNRLVDKDGNAYTTQGRYYGPALRCKSKGKCKEDKFYIEDPAQAPYTPPYFYGKAKARLAYRPSMSGKPTLDDIHKNTTIQYINKDLEKKFSSKTSESGSLDTWQDTPAYRGRMPIESSINLFGKTLDSETGEYAWSISTKFESPVLNFDTTSNKETRYYGIERSYWKTSLDVGENPCSTREDRNIYGAVDRDPRGVGMWSGYAKSTGRGSLYLELVKPSSRQQKHSTVDNDIDTNPYIIQLAIKAANNWLGLMSGKITLRDPYGVENEITIGQPNHASSLRSLFHPTPEAAKIFHVSEKISLYSTHAKIRTVYTAAESTEDNHAKGMSNAFDIEAQLVGGQVGDIGIPMPFDIANAICYHINYRYNKEENFNWVAEVKWVREQDRSGVRGASLGVNSRLEKVKKYDPSFGTNGAVVELEWRPNYKIFRDVSWRLNNPKLYDLPSAKVELPWSEMGTTNEQNKATSGSPFGRSSGNTTGKSLPSDILNFYERSQYDSFGQTTSTDFTRVNSVDWAAFYPKIPSNREEKTGSLAEVCGFSPAKSRVGDIADTKVISEAVVMIPFTEKYYEDRSVRIGEYRDEDGKKILSKNFFKISRQLAMAAAIKFEEGDLTNEISSMIDKMQRYNIPPIYDFVKYGLKIDPFVMYIFEFEEKLNKDDLANIWQGLMPRCAKAATRYDSEHPENRQMIEHKLDEENFFEGKKIPEDIQWMTFKVKKKANVDYYKLTADSIDDKDFKFKVESDDTLKPDYSYNWPYDYCSLIEMTRVTGGVDIVPEKPSAETGEEEHVKDRAQEVEFEPAPVVVALPRPLQIEPALPRFSEPIVTTIGNSSLVSQSNHQISAPSAPPAQSSVFGAPPAQSSVFGAPPAQSSVFGAPAGSTPASQPRFSLNNLIMGGGGFGGFY